MGRGAIARSAARREQLGRQGEQLTAETAAQMKSQLQSFKVKLEQFALRHKEEIQRDPAFRAKFHTMCAAIGVDPLTSRKGVWNDLLGVGDYYYELAVRVVEVCVRTRPMNGGLLSLTELTQALREKRVTYTENVSADDVERAVSKLGVFGGGFEIVRVGQERIVQSVPMELSRSHTQALAVCGQKGFLTLSQLCQELMWDEHKAKATLQFLLDKEFAWVDMQGVEPMYWVLGLVQGAATRV